jgi:CBS domain containing-hemolysin-like protein
MGRIRHVPASARETTRLIDVACPLAEVPIGAPSEPIPELLQRMQAAADGRALVIDEKGAFVGIVSPSDIARYVQLCMLQSQGRSPRRG